MVKSYITKGSNRIIAVIVLLSIAAFSFFVLTGITTNPDNHAAFVKSLDDKRDTVMALTVSAAGVSTLLSALPGDMATSIAEQIAELGSYFLVLLVVIVFEKTLLLTSGYISFNILIPIACAACIHYLYTGKESALRLAKKLAIFGLAIYFVTPICLQFGDLVADVNRSSFEKTMAAIEQNAQEADEAEDNLIAEEKNLLQKVGESISDFATHVVEGASAIIEKVKVLPGLFMDAISMLIIVCIVVPIVILVIFAWVIKITFGIEVRIERKLQDATKQS